MLGFLGLEAGELLPQTNSNGLGQRCVLARILQDLQSGDARGAGALLGPHAPAGLNQERGTGSPEASCLSERTHTHTHPSSLLLESPSKAL